VEQKNSKALTKQLTKMIQVCTSDTPGFYVIFCFRAYGFVIGTIKLATRLHKGFEHDEGAKIL
jgi:hypothetical protein